MDNDEPDQEPKDDDDGKDKRGKAKDEAPKVIVKTKQDVSKKSQSKEGPRMSDYSRRREENMARNKELLAAVMGDLHIKKDASKKGKGEKLKPNMPVGEHRTSARLKAADRPG